MATYQILLWRDIPSQVKVWDDFEEVNLDLGPRFIARIDQAAQSEGLTGTDEYLGQWAWSEEREREGTAGKVAQALVKELEERFL
ncbi:MAG: virulence factor [Bacteroidota bacterium]